MTIENQDVIKEARGLVTELGENPVTDVSLSLEKFNNLSEGAQSVFEEEVNKVGDLLLKMFGQSIPSPEKDMQPAR